MNIKVIIESGEDGYFVARVPSLKGCWSQGKTREEALENIREAIDLYLEPEGSHEKMKHLDGRLIVFPFHDEIDRFTLKMCVGGC
ncbi:MAG: type II toxin-antitoxin system HicB family antitoxin [Pyrinomonadaceae bacterium]